MDKRKNTILLYGVASNKPFCFFVKGRTEILQKAVKSDDQERKCFGDIGMDDKISPGYLKKEQNQDIVYEGIMKKAL